MIVGVSGATSQILTKAFDSSLEKCHQISLYYVEEKEISVYFYVHFDKLKMNYLTSHFPQESCILATGPTVFLRQGQKH